MSEAETQTINPLSPSTPHLAVGSDCGGNQKAASKGF